MVPPHIIAWGDSERSTSPVSTSTASLVSIDSITSDTRSTAPEPRATLSRPESMSFPVFLGNRESGAHPANGDPFTRHDKYYFKDGNITFLVRPCFMFDRMKHYLLCQLRSMALFTASTDTSSIETRRISPLDSNNSVFANTKPCPS
jgi:hypothetical protein